MAGITKYLGIAIADAEAGRITLQHLLDILQEAIDNGDVLVDGNEQYVVATVFPLIDSGVLRPSVHTESFARRMNSVAKEWLGRRDAGPPFHSGGAGVSRPELIVTHANQVGRILHDYVAIHDDIFGGGLVRTLRRMVPIPGIFQAVDFDRHDRDLAVLADELRSVVGQVANDDPATEHADSLARYCHALMAAVVQLQGISRKLAGRGDDPNSYDKQAYRVDLVRYEQAVATYRSMGEEINRAFRGAP